MRVVFLAALSVAATMLVGSALPIAHSADPSSVPNHSISVTADGTVQVAPNIAYVSVGVQSTNIDAAKAQSDTNAAAAKAIAGIEQLGILAIDIQTSGISLDRQYDDRNVLTGFQASDTLVVTVEHRSLTGSVIDAAVQAGANRSLSVNLRPQRSDHCRRCGAKGGSSRCSSKSGCSCCATRRLAGWSQDSSN